MEIMQDTLKLARVVRIRSHLSSAIAVLREPSKYGSSTPYMVPNLEQVMDLIPDLNRVNPGLRDNPVYEPQYKSIVKTLAQVIQHLKMHDLLTDLEEQ
jgi:hypothetical protein